MVLVMRTLLLFVLANVANGQGGVSLTADQLRLMHGKWDLDLDGKVSLNEITEYADEIRGKIAMKSVDGEIAAADSDNDGKLSMDEMIKHLGDVSDYENEKEYENRKNYELEKFKEADKDYDKILSHEECANFFYPETHDGVLKIVTAESMRFKDKDLDGKLNMNEFWEVEDEQITEEQRDEFASLDVNADGRVDDEEMEDWESGRFHTRHAMHVLIKQADSDEDGHLDAQELADATTHLDEESGYLIRYQLSEWVDHHQTHDDTEL